MKITKEQALESAQRRGFQIPDWMLEKAEKKRGRPAATVAAAIVDPTALAIDTGNDDTKTNETKDTKEKKPRQPRAKATTKATTTKATTKATTTKATTTKATTTKATTTKKTAKTIIATQDTPQKKNSAQSSICIDLNNDDESVTPVADAASIAVASVASVASSIPQENEKKKRGRPTKSNTQSNVGESEMQQLIVQATTEKKKRLSLDAAAADTHTSEEGVQVETHLTFEENGNEEEQLGEDEIFEMFDKMLENENEKNQQEKQQEQVVTVATKEKKGKSEKKAKKSDDKEKVEKEKISKKEAALKKAQEEEAALKKAQEEAAFKKNAEAEDGEETEDEEEDESNEEEAELECEEYEYDGETYGLAPNGDIYSQDGDLVGKLTNGVPNMFN
jgi:hypothetical protein